MGSSRYTRKSLKAEIDLYNDYLKEEKIPYRLEVEGRCNYSAVDFYRVDKDGQRIGSGIEGTAGTGTPRECIAAARNYYGGWVRKFGEAKPAPETRAGIRTRYLGNDKYSASDDQGRRVFLKVSGELRNEVYHQQAAQKWIERYAHEPDEMVVKWAAVFDNDYFWVQMRRGTDRY